jgi:hypothetical protein
LRARAWARARSPSPSPSRPRSRPRQARRGGNESSASASTDAPEEKAALRWLRDRSRSEPALGDVAMLPADVTVERCERRCWKAAAGTGCSLSPKLLNHGITADMIRRAGESVAGDGGAASSGGGGRQHSRTPRSPRPVIRATGSAVTPWVNSGPNRVARNNGGFFCWKICSSIGSTLILLQWASRSGAPDGMQAAHSPAARRAGQFQRRDSHACSAPRCVCRRQRPGSAPRSRAVLGA